MPKVNLGRVGFVLQGNHSTTKTYKRLDCVMYNNATYAAIEDVPAGTAITNTQYWQLLIDANGILQDIDAFKDHLIMVQDTEPTEADNRLWIKSTQGDEVQIPTWAEHEALAGEVDKKTIKHLLTYDGTNIKEDSTVLTYAAIHAMLMDKPDFVVLVYNERAYHPTRVSNDQIVFIASFVSNGYPTMDRISISNKNVVTVTTGTAEMKVNKVTAVNDANKEDTDKYPSVKAVVDYVQPTIDETAKLKDDIVTLESILVNEDARTDVTNNYYAHTVPMANGKTYRIGVSVQTAGNYGVMIGTNGMSSAMIDTLFADGTHFDAGEIKYTLYTPDVDGVEWIRLSVGNLLWTAYVAEAIDVHQLVVDTAAANNGLVVTGENVDAIGAKVDAISDTLVTGENRVDRNNVMYADLGELTVGKAYRIGISVRTAGKYGVSLCTSASASTIVSTIFPNGTNFAENEKKYIFYKPVTAGIRYARLTSDNVGWSAYIAEVVDLGDLSSEPSVKYYDKTTLQVGDNLVSASSPVTAGAGWSGSFAGGYTHASGSTEELVFTGGTTNGERYIVEFDATGVTDTRLLVSIGNNPQVDIYNGSSHFTVGFVADGGPLRFIPVSNYVGKISNISLRKVVESGGIPFTQTLKNVNHGNVPNNITGFWNIAIGADNTQDSNQNGSRNVAIGYAAEHQLKTGTRNIAVGTFSMPFIESGDRNIAIGADSLYSTKGYQHPHAEDNVAIGYRAMADGTNIKSNVAIGTRAMSECTPDAANNVAIGSFAGVYANAGVVAIGESAGTRSYTKPSNSVFLGRGCGIDNTGATSVSPKSVSNAIAIGYRVDVKNSNEARFGNATNIVYLAGKKIIFNADHTVTWEDE